MTRWLVPTALLVGCATTTDSSRVVIPAQPAPVASARAPELVAAKDTAAMRPFPEPACRIAREAAKTEYSVHLFYQEREFAVVGGEMTKIEARLGEGDQGGTISLVRDGISLLGEIRTVDIALESPPDALLDDWMEARGAPVVLVAPDGLLTAQTQNPRFVDPRNEVAFNKPCATASFFTTDARPSGATRYLKDGATTTLRTKLGGPVVADVVVPAGAEEGSEREVTLLEQKGKWARVRIGPFDEVSYAWGWIDSSSLAASSPTLAPREEPVADERPNVTCDHDLPIFVHDGDQMLRVGLAKKGARVHVNDRSAPEPTLDLRLAPFRGPIKYSMQNAPLEEAFVTRESLAGCK